jgi:hypothetical protein
MYAYCTGDPICGGPNIVPSSRTEAAAFDITLAGLALPEGASLTSANLLISGLDLGSFVQPDDQAAWNQELWNVNTGTGNFTSINVGSYSLALSDTDGSFIISDPNVLAALAAGNPIDIQGYAAVTTYPTFGTQNAIPVINIDSFGIITAQATAYSSTPVFDTQYYSPTAEIDGVTAVTAVPEPSSLLLLASGFAQLLGMTAATKRARSYLLAELTNRWCPNSFQTQS